MPDFLDEKKAEIEARLAELKPLVEEYKVLEALMAVLDGVPVAPKPAPATRTRRPRPQAPAGTRPRGRPKGSGTRGAEALALVVATGSEGISIPDIAGKMGIKPNYLYRVLPGLADDGLVEKRGLKWFAKPA